MGPCSPVAPLCPVALWPNWHYKVQANPDFCGIAVIDASSRNLLPTSTVGGLLQSHGGSYGSLLSCSSRCTCCPLCSSISFWANLPHRTLFSLFSLRPWHPRSPCGPCGPVSPCGPCSPLWTLCSYRSSFSQYHLYHLLTSGSNHAGVTLWSNWSSVALRTHRSWISRTPLGAHLLVSSLGRHLH